MCEQGALSTSSHRTGPGETRGGKRVRCLARARVVFAARIAGSSRRCEPGRAGAGCRGGRQSRQEAGQGAGVPGRAGAGAVGCSGALTGSVSALADGQTSVPVLGQVNASGGTRAHPRCTWDHRPRPQNQAAPGRALVPRGSRRSQAMLLFSRSFSGDWKVLHIEHQRGTFLVSFPDLTKQEKAMGSLEGASGSWSRVCFQTRGETGSILSCLSLPGCLKDKSAGVQLAHEHCGFFLFCPKLSNQKDQVAGEFRKDFLNFTNASCLLKSN